LQQLWGIFTFSQLDSGFPEQAKKRRLIEICGQLVNDFVRWRIGATPCIVE
jgi:hypothetical protein